MEGCQEQEVLVLRGPSQSGKSSFMAKAMTPGQVQPAVGDGSGESVTRDTALRNTVLGSVLDGPGDGDSFLRFTDEEAGRRYAVAVAEAGASRVKFLVFESLVADRMGLRATLASLVAAFGAGALEGVVVVASKADARPGGLRDKRLAAVRRAMEEQGLEELVVWQSEGLDEAQEKAQLDDLRSALARVRGVSPADLADLWQRQRLRAQELFDAQVPQTKQIDVQEEHYTEEPYEVKETISMPMPKSEQVWVAPRGPFLKDISFSEITECPDEHQVRYFKYHDDAAYPYVQWAGVRAHFKWTDDESEAVRDLLIGVGSPPAGYEKVAFKFRRFWVWHSGWKTCRRDDTGRPDGGGMHVFFTREGNAAPITKVGLMRFADPAESSVQGCWTILLQNLCDRFEYVVEYPDQYIQKYMYLAFQRAEVGRYETVTKTVLQDVQHTAVVPRYTKTLHTVSKSIEYKLPVESFWQISLDQVLTEIRATFAGTGSAPEDSIGPDDSLSAVGARQGPVASHVGCSLSRLGRVLAEESSEVSWSTIGSIINRSEAGGSEAQCFTPDALFTTWVDPSSPDQGSFRQSAEDLRRGSRVAKADGTGTLEVVGIKEHDAERRVLLQAGEDVAPLKVTPSHLVAVPGGEFRPAGDLREGDLVLCSVADAQQSVQLTRAEPLDEAGPVFEITFSPNEPVATFHPPTGTILSKCKASKPCRRSGMNRRGQGSRPAEEQCLSVPDTAGRSDFEPRSRRGAD